MALAVAEALNPNKPNQPVAIAADWYQYNKAKKVR